MYNNGLTVNSSSKTGIHASIRETLRKPPILFLQVQIVTTTVANQDCVLQIDTNPERFFQRDKKRDFFCFLKQWET